MKSRLVFIERAAAPYALVGVLMIILFTQQNKESYINLIGGGILTCVFYFAWINNYRKNHIMEKEQNRIIKIPGAATVQIELQNKKNINLVIGILTFVMPLFTAGVSGKLLDGAMRLASIRIDNAVIYTKAPYNDLLPDTLVLKELNHSKDYKAYKDITVLFKGFGMTTVISFKDGSLTRKLEIPNEYIVVEKRI